MTPEDPRVSDEVTGLPPISELEPSNTLVLLAWDATEGVASMPNGESVAVRYLHVRGVMPGVDGTGVDWGQCHVAVPVEVVLEVAGHLVRGSTAEL